ncbi:MAG: aminotransferase class I/II-fold pyridoxal phosphate-dependent enzyme [Ignavibacteriae bacterium]|nr:aminotransferase class I/II-fold pyridoxal phosphate-dependent enzyme [Ignavibacteria bacterium]MBI3365818.1 aminotransferase class I/II-fold pyridoxal phosphate-dependent enzyme [Ignavibacteriota bacterium]
MAHGLIGSEVLKIANEIHLMVAEGKTICNLTVGDFSPTEFRIPQSLEKNIADALRAGETNYPPSDGMPALRKAVSTFYEKWLELEYPVESILICGGSRPAIYATYRVLIDPGDVVVYPVPSWNNNHYSHLVGARGIPVVCSREDNFLPTRRQLEKVLRGARLLSVNSPLNPTGTAFSKEMLTEICELVLEENARRSKDERPLYLLYDQVYWLLTHGSTVHYNPVGLRPEIAPYTIFVDGISKAFAATGIRVGWVVGPADVVARMASIIGHVGAWAPRAEQVAVAKLLDATDEVVAFENDLKRGLQSRLDRLYTVLSALHSEGYAVDAIAPMGAIYLSARFALNGKRSAAGNVLQTNEDIRKYLLEEAGVAIVPFQAFGTTVDDGWFRLSVGAVSLSDIDAMAPRLRSALARLSD